MSEFTGILDTVARGEPLNEADAYAAFDAIMSG